MKAEEPLLSQADYVKVLKRQLPPEAFAPRPRKLLLIVAHLLVIAVSYMGIRSAGHVAAMAPISVILGHSLMCLVFLTHELSHNAIVRRRTWRYGLEAVLWGLNLIPATMWRELHNNAHHRHANTLADPDRFFLKAELDAREGGLRRWYTRLFFPHRFTLKWNPLVGFHFATYIVRHVAAVMYPADRRPTIVTYRPVYSPAQRVRISAELGLVVLLQIGVYVVTGSQWQRFIWASPIPLLLASTFAMAYIWTNHYLHGLRRVYDPVASSTSVVVHPIFDFLHSHFSYHAEHHVFPTMSSDFYPLVSKLIEKNFPGKLHRLPIREAWRLLWRGKPYIHESLL